MIRRISALLFIAAGLFGVACGGSDDSSKPSTSSSASSASASPATSTASTTGAKETSPVMPVTLKDKDGKDVTVKDVSRIIPLNGDIAEIISSLGLKQNVVAADISATIPADYQKLPSIGYQRTLNAEGIISMKPTVIVGNEMAGPPEVIEQIKSIGIPVILLKSSSTLEGVAPKIKAIATALGVPNRGYELAKTTQKDIDDALAKAAKAQGKPNVMFLYLRGANVQVIMGEGSGADSLIKAAGGRDSGVDAGIKGTKPITPEALVTAMPDVLLVLTAGLQSVGGVDGLLKVPGVAQTPAGQKRKVIDMDDQYLLGFNSQVGKALMDLVNKMHPEYGSQVASLASALSLDRTRRLPRLAALPAMGVMLAVMFIVSLGIGSVEISPPQVVGILAQRLLHLDIGVTYSQQQELVLWNIRLPRICIGVLAGCGLATAGAALQGIFRNPLADPGLIGSSSGAAVGAVAMIMLGVAPLGGTFTMPVAAFAGALALTLLVYSLSRHYGRTEVVTLILTGVALNAIAGATIGLMVFYASDAQLRSITFWMLGSLGGSTWRIVYATVPFVVIGSLLLMTTRRALNLMVLGEREAFHLGISTERLRMIVIGLAALVAGAVVAAIGIIGFVGLMVPHLMRLLLGPDHRTLLPASAIGGAILLLAADLVARVLLSPLELPLGIVTAMIGGPYFLWLLHYTRRTQGGWG